MAHQTSLINSSAQLCVDVSGASCVSPSTNRMKKLPINILEYIFTFLKINHVALDMHVVCRDWRFLKQNDTRLVLRDLKINTVGLTQLLEQYKDRNILSIELQRCSKLVDKSLKLLTQFTSLTALSLTGMLKITDRGIALFSKMPLKSLVLSNCSKITSEGLAAFSHLTLTKFAGSNVSDLGFLSNMPIHELSLKHARLSEEQMRHISRLPLKKLYLDCSDISDTGLKMLPLSLTHLSLLSCKFLTPKGFQSLSSFSHLTFLDLSSTCVTDESLQALSACRIKFLSLAVCTQITNLGLHHLNPTLEGLNLTGCTPITDKGLEILSTHPLIFLNLTDCHKISDEGIKFLSPGPLRHLILRYCWRLTDKTLSTIAPLRLIHLDLRNCKGITHAATKSKIIFNGHIPRDFFNEQR